VLLLQKEGTITASRRGAASASANGHESYTHDDATSSNDDATSSNDDATSSNNDDATTSACYDGTANDDGPAPDDDAARHDAARYDASCSIAATHCY
jgi:hypothetical protein